MPDRDVSQVLVVDDEPELRELLVEALSAADLRVSTAAGAEEALRLALHSKPDLLVMDIRLPEANGLEVIDKVRSEIGDVPAVVITGYGSEAVFVEASRRHPLELMTKPLDLERLRGVIRKELARQAGERRFRRRTQRLRTLARNVNIERKCAHGKLQGTCAELTSAYRGLSEQMAMHEVVIDYQRDLLNATNDDDVFRSLFRLFVRRSGPLFGVAMTCNADAELQVVGRFGVPIPDSLAFCQAIAQPVINYVLATPHCMLLDAGEQAEMFCPSIRRYLVGVTVLAVPLMPAEGEIIGVAVLYRKGEQPFIDTDVALAQAIAPPTALCIRKND